MFWELGMNLSLSLKYLVKNFLPFLKGERKGRGKKAPVVVFRFREPSNETKILTKTPQQDFTEEEWGNSDPIQYE